MLAVGDGGERRSMAAAVDGKSIAHKKVPFWAMMCQGKKRTAGEKMALVSDTETIVANVAEKRRFVEYSGTKWYNK